MQREFRHNTDAQVEEYIGKALNLVERLDPPDDLRGLVFNQAVTMYAAKSITLEQVQPLGGLLAAGGG